MRIDLPTITRGILVGKINVATREVWTNYKSPVKFSCSMSGDCCRRFHIPVTDFDIQRIQEYYFDLEQIVSDFSPHLKMPKTEYRSIEKNYNMKHQPFTNTCTFLIDNQCSIHEFRPFGCRIFPFQFFFISQEVVNVVVHNSNSCPFVVAVEHGENDKLLKYLASELAKELSYREK